MIKRLIYIGVSLTYLVLFIGILALTILLTLPGILPIFSYILKGDATLYMEAVEDLMNYFDNESKKYNPDKDPLIETREIAKLDEEFNKLR